MNVRERQVAERSERISREVQTALGQFDWYVRFRFHQDLEGQEATDSDEGLDASATSVITKALWQYRMTTFHVYLPAVATQSDEQLRFIWVHEWVHVMHSGMTPYIKSGTNGSPSHLADEWTTETIAKAFMLALGWPLPTGDAA